MTKADLFEFNDLPVRIHMMNGEPWFVAADVGRVLGMTNIRKNLADMREDWKGVTESYTLGGQQEVTIICEAAVYKLAFRSNKPEAEAFTEWVAGEVLPSIRKTGAYIAPEPVISEGEIYLRTGRVLYSQKCKICTSPHAVEINSRLTAAETYDSIIEWAAEQGLSISKSGLSRHNSMHRVPDFAEKSLLENPEIATRVLLAKLSEIAQRRTLDGLTDRELVKYIVALSGVLNRDGASSKELPATVEA